MQYNIEAFVIIRLLSVVHSNPVSVSFRTQRLSLIDYFGELVPYEVFQRSRASELV